MNGLHCALAAPSDVPMSSEVFMETSEKVFELELGSG